MAVTGEGRRRHILQPLHESGKFLLAWSRQLRQNLDRAGEAASAFALAHDLAPHHAVIEDVTAHHPLLAVEQVILENTDAVRRHGELRATRVVDEVHQITGEGGAIAAVIEHAAVLVEAVIGLNALAAGPRDMNLVPHRIERFRDESGRLFKHPAHDLVSRHPHEVRARHALHRTALQDVDALRQLLRREIRLHEQQDAAHQLWHADLVVPPVGVLKIRVEPGGEGEKQLCLQFRRVL